MKLLMAAVALAGAAWGCDAKAAPTAAPVPQADGPSYQATVKIDDV